MGTGKFKKIFISSALVGIMTTTPLTVSAALGDQTLSRGMWDEDVIELQQLLDEKGFYDYHKATGFFGTITESGVEAFQEAHGLVVDGIVGPKTFAAFRVATTTEQAMLLRQGDRGEQVEDLQRQLHDLNYYNGAIDGIFGPVTAEAVRAFQRANHLKVDGIAGSKTMGALKNEPIPVTTVSRGQESNDDVGKTFYAESSAYTASCTGCSGVTYTGVNLNKNPDAKVVAVDPDIIPLGSKVWVEGYGDAVAADIGSAIQGKEVDVFFPERSTALQWGVQKVKVKILE